MKLYFLSSSCLLIQTVVSFSVVQQNPHRRPSIGLHSVTSSSSDDADVVLATANNLESALDDCRSEITKTCKVAIGVSSKHRLGLIATSNIKKGEVVLSIPYDDRLEITPKTARKEVFAGVLEDTYEGWMGDSGLIALQLLNEVVKATTSTTTGGIPKPQRPAKMQSLVTAWIQALLPQSNNNMEYHPFLWPEEDQEVLQSSSTNKLYRALDDMEEDATWLVENIFGKDRDTFPETVTWKNQEIPCFSVDGYRWAMAISQSRSVFVDGTLRLLPILDMCNHDDEGEEISGGYMGTFGTTQGAQLVASQKYKAGEEVFCSYGPKSAADYLLEHGFCPPQSWKTAVSEITLELDSKDRFYEDKLDILEFETYDGATMDPTQSFDVVSVPGGRDGEPDPAMIQFARLCQLGGTDAFLLESIFRKECWEFMALPVSERNELQVVNSISVICEKALEDLGQCPEGGPEVCTKLRESETKALTRTLEFLQREKQALDLKEYYQERRLKDLGLGSDWIPEEEDGFADPDLAFGQTRAPGGADYDW